MSIQKRHKASDVFRETQHLFGKTSDFDKAFPGIEEVKVEVEETGEGIYGESRKSTYNKFSMPGEFVDCSNPLCYDGGLSLGRILRNMGYNNKQTELEISETCQGYEGSPKGRIKYRECLNDYKIKVSIKYKEAADLESE